MLLHVFNPEERSKIIADSRKNGFRAEPHLQNPHAVYLKKGLNPNMKWLDSVENKSMGSIFSHEIESQKNVMIPHFQLLADQPQIQNPEIQKIDAPNVDTQNVNTPHTPNEQPTTTRMGDNAAKYKTFPPGTFLPTDIFRIYNSPTPSTTRPNIAIIELGGGYKATDLTYYWTKVLGYPSNSVPTVTTVSVDGGKNRTGSDADFEVVLDIEVVGGMFPNGKVNIYVYFAPNTVQGFYDAFQAAIYNTQTPFSAISCSWGAAETYWTQQSMTAYNQLFAQAVSRGITIFCASGDNGSNDGVGGSSLNVDFPASASNVIACGGTRLVCPTRNYADPSTVETAWTGSGGGFSSLFTPPSYQVSALQSNSLPTAKRGSPDVCGLADPATGWVIYLRGNFYVIGGTSAVSPMWSALWTNCLKSTKRFAGPIIYPRLSTSSFHDITSGSNGAYSARTGYDLVTGLGSPQVTNLKAVV